MVVRSKDGDINLKGGDGNNNDITTNSSSTELSSLRQLGVLGIGLIMEEVGKGARLVFRYPASPPPFFSVSRGGQPEMKNSTNKSNKSSTKNKKDIGEEDSTSGSSDSIDLFFDLPARVISKLFRPKRPLCGQPLTLNVSGTTFCCRAELFDSHPSTIGGEGPSSHPLVLFSVIVALAPLAPSIRASMAENQSSSNNNSKYKNNPFNAEDMHIRNSPNIHAVDSTQSRSDAAFLTITKIHRNLARLCRVLKREEIRCNYVSRQCEMLLQIKKEYELRVGPDCSGSNDSVPNNNNNTATSDTNSKKGDIIPPTSPKGNSTVSNSKEKKKTKLISDDDDHDKTNQMTREQRREYVQDLIENLLAASPPTDNADDDNDDDGDIKLQGNLARELANVFHFMSSSTTANSSNNLTRREGVVYINRHVAVPLEPIDQLSKTKHQYSIEPHQTLLFQGQSATEVLNGLIDDGVNDMSASSSSISQTLCRLLPNIQPRKSLTDIAWDSSISLPYAMNASTWLIRSGICIAATPVIRKNRYKCVDDIVQKMAKLALGFWQTFGVRSQRYEFYWGGGEATAGAPHIFVVVSSLTSKRKDGLSISASPTLGEAFDLLIGRQAESSPHLKRHNSRASSSSLGSVNATSPNEDETAEQVLYSMAVWLIANKVIVLA